MGICYLEFWKLVYNLYDNIKLFNKVNSVSSRTVGERGTNFLSGDGVYFISPLSSKRNTAKGVVINSGKSD